MYAPMHGQHRFRTPLDYRYRLYPLPSVADVRCPKCRSRCKFSITPQETFAKDGQSGGDMLRPLPIETSVLVIQWPEDTYLQQRFTAEQSGHGTRHT
jgi:hypothetical protein